ncbi:aldose 1-epimerase [Gordonia sp. (in: high G+C Gram-positive bacteria)]|uniref:aldose epimerase family protein n=1 Tax=Gordonia sp. (in: high G+C Gram-positive bacteria) TaxID=84139 RepID=UPI0035274627
MDDDARRETVAHRIAILRSPVAEAVIDTAGGAVVSFRVNGVELLLQGSGHGCFPMVPWCGRLVDGELRFGGAVHRFGRNAGRHAIHGTVREEAWEVVSSSPSGLVLAQHLYPRWPFRGWAVQMFRLAGAELVMHLRVSSAGEAFPAQAGWHPWFRKSLDGGRRDAVSLGFDPGWQEERDADFVLTGRRIVPRPRPWDDCFGTPGGVVAELRWAEFGALTVRSDAEWAVVYDHGAEALCLEPQSGPPDAVNSRPFVVTPERALTVSASWAWSPDPPVRPAESPR